MTKNKLYRDRIASRQNGFTIVELLIVIVVIAILAAITIVAFNGIQNRAVAATLQSDLNAAAKTLKLYQVDNGAYPTSIDSTTYCPTPADDRYCLKASAGNSLVNYSANNTTNPQTFTLNAVNANNGAQYYVSESRAAEESSDTVTIAATTGSTTTGSTLTAGAITPSGATVTRQWQRATSAGGTYANIAGATGPTYVLASGDAGHYIRHAVTGTGSYSGTVNSAPTAMVTTPVTAIAAITGTTTQGSTLTAGAITPSGATVTRQWQRATSAGGTYANIAGATGSTYVLTSGDVGYYIRHSVTGTGNYSGTVNSAPTAMVTTPLTAIAPISGTATQGSTLTAGARTPAAATVTFQWKRDGVNIAGATGSSYVLTAAEVGGAITVTATGTGGYTGAVTSAPTAIVN